jgi:general secretion pathway protein G
MNMKLDNRLNAKHGFTLFELLITVMVLAILSAVAIPVIKSSQRRDKEIELYQTLRYMREAIDNYKRAADMGIINPPPEENFGYPESLEILVEGAPRRSGMGSVPFLRKIPTDPITGRAEWSLRSINDERNTSSWGGGSVFDVRSTAKGTGLNGVPYKEW